MDALSVGVKIVAYERPFFVSISEHFGSDSVAVCSSYEELVTAMEKESLRASGRFRHERLHRLAESKYSIPAVRDSFERLLEYDERRLIRVGEIRE